MSNDPKKTCFQDPLENYDPRQYDDSLEQALAEETVAAVQHEPYVTIPPTMPVGEAVEKLAKLQVACVMVTQEDRLVGLFSDRDVLNQVALEYENVKDQPVSEVMTSAPVFVYDTDSAAAVLSVMAVSGYRHVPVLHADGTVVGIVSPQRITGFLQKHFAD